MPGTVPGSENPAVGKIGKSLALKKCTLMSSSQGNEKNGTVFSGFSKGSRRYKFSLPSFHPNSFLENHAGYA